jgi:hypothetical protein
VEIELLTAGEHAGQEIEITAEEATHNQGRLTWPSHCYKLEVKYIVRYTSYLRLA